MGAALALSEENDVHLFEKDGRIGGHANTVDVAFGDTVVPVDTGFIVYNTVNYPNLTGLFAHLDVPTKVSDMSFGLSVDGGATEYACDSFDTLFAQRSNLFRPRFIKGLREILRFNEEAPALLDQGKLDGLSLGAFLSQYRYSDWFRDNFVLAMGGAIWSTPTAMMLEFPAESFVSFFRNHGLMNGMGETHKWRTVDGGSRAYISRIMQALGDRVHAGAEVVGVDRSSGLPKLHFADGNEAVFDQVILACHGPQARALLGDQDEQEEQILSAFRTSDNRAVLHSDPALMPKRKKVWSSWNFLAGRNAATDRRPAAVTYWMQRLQGIAPEHPLFVSLNPARDIDPDLIHREFTYAHPIFDSAAFRAQSEISAIQGRGGVWYAGAWLGYGFHEDGLRAGLAVAHALGAAPNWAKGLPEPAASPLQEAAE